MLSTSSTHHFCNLRCGALHNQKNQRIKERACSLQVSQSELDLEKFAASILLDDGPLPGAEDLGQARASDSSLQGSNGEWEGMLVDNLSVATSMNGSMPEQGPLLGTALSLTCSEGSHALYTL